MVSFAWLREQNLDMIPWLAALGWGDRLSHATICHIDTEWSFCPISPLCGPERAVLSGNMTRNPGLNPGRVAASGISGLSRCWKLRMRAGGPAHFGMVRSSKAEACTG